ncbi:MAG TPA: HAMP domain-containing sensor histidine kinase [Kofleriaceae bacterium]|nr:HAMP domain-containing sensor histidine kinase [Kofleriaceae bacterium]
MVRIAAPPAVVQLRRAQLTLLLATLLPTVLMIGLGIVLLATGRGTGAVVIGILVLAFCTASLTGYILGSTFVRRGAQVARFQNDYLSLVSHELRTPLTSILMFLDTLRDERLTDPVEKQQCFDILDREVRRLDHLLERLLQLSKIQTGRSEFARELVEVSAVVDEALVHFQASTLTEKVLVEADTAACEGVRVMGDHDGLAHAVANLLLNAWKYTPPEARRIGLRCDATDRHVDLTVWDNGPGVPSEERERIFAQFERGQEATRSGRGGSGLGLAIVRAIVRAHRGRVDMRARLEGGSEFRIRLPRARGTA